MMAEVNKSKRKQYMIAGCIYFGQFLVGFGMGWAVPVFVKLQDPDETPLERAITDAEASWIASLFLIGLIAGPYISGYLCNVVGRKPCLFFGGSILVLSYILLAVAKSLALIYVARTLAGVGSGVLFVTNLIYIGELASTSNRGTLLTLTGLTNIQGIVTVYTMGPFVSFAKLHWMAVFLCVEYVVAVFFMVPESAVYQVMKGKTEEALAKLTSLGRQDDIDEMIVRINDKPKPKMAQLTEIYTVKSNRRAVFIIISLNIFTQLSGMTTVIAFVKVIFEMTGLNMEAHISFIIIGITQLLASITAPVLVDRIGRKTLMLASSAVCSLSLAVLGTYFYLYDNDYAFAEDLQWVSLVSVVIFCVAYYYGMGIIPNTFIGEMFTDTCRGFGGTITVTISWLFGFGVTTSFGYIMTAWGPSVIFWMFSCSCAFAFFFSIVFVPETKGKSLLEIRELLSK